MEKTMQHSTPESEHAPGLDTEMAQGRLSLNGRWALWAMLGVVAIGIVGAIFISSRDSSKPTEKQTLVADPHGVTLTEDAPQWKYAELSVAKMAPALMPLPAPGRVD